MDPEGGSNDGSCYYSILGIPRDASFSDIRTAYWNLALKWHPDRWAGNFAIIGEAKRRFQQIQEAYSVLSDQSKRSMYDAGFSDPLDEVRKVSLIYRSGKSTYRKQGEVKLVSFGRMPKRLYRLSRLVLGNDLDDEQGEGRGEQFGRSAKDACRNGWWRWDGMSFELKDDRTSGKGGRVSTPMGNAAKRSNPLR